MIRGIDLRDDEEGLPFRFVRSHVALWQHDAQVWRVLLDMANEVLGTDHWNPTLMGLEWIHQRILDAFERGRLLLIHKGEDEDAGGGSDAGGGGGGGAETGPSRRGDETKSGSSAPAKPPAPETPKEQLKTWFRARLLDEDGEPMSGEDYILVDTDGVQRKGKLDAKGEVYIPPILPAGTCKISFPNIHLNPRKRKK